MRKFMVIGLGGSGGKTLGFLMDELRFTLGPEWQGRDLPKCWQFVHIDVPTQADTAGKALAAAVQDQGGTYVGLAGPDANYTAMQNVTFNRMRDADPSAHTHLARWKPTEEFASTVDVQNGAGAMRAIGRIATLSQSAQITNALLGVIARLNSSESSADLAAITQNKSAASIGKSQPPVVLIVSSMAGGSGASMVLDVSDLIRGLHNGSEFDGLNTSAFLYTAEVFGGKITNPGSGTLATISELQAAMLNKDEWTQEQWNVLGTNRPKPSSIGRGPHAIFPVGAKSHGVPFGTEPEDVYRGFAKMLAPVFTSESLQVKFINYMKTNGPKDATDNPDHSRITRTVDKGSLQGVEYAHFMGWGSATLTTGRKRYLEYASQRLAREAARVLIEGHGVDSAIVSNPMQQKRQIADNFLPGFLRALPVGADQAGNLSAPGLLEAAFPQAASLRLVDPFRTQLSSAFSTSGSAGGAAAASHLGMHMKEGLERAFQEAKTQAVQSLQGWASEMQGTVENEYLHIVSIKGLEVANLVLAEAGRRLISTATRELGTTLAVQLESPLSVANRELQAISSLRKEVVLPNSRPALNFLGNVSKAMSNQLRKEIGQVLQSIVPDFVVNCMGTLEASSSERLETLMKELSLPPQDFATAAYREAPITSWPQGENVPSHFQPAINEVMLDSVSTFPGHFWTHLGMTVENVQAGTSDLVQVAAQEVLIGADRARTDENKFKNLQGWRVSYSPFHEFIGRRSTWMPKDLAIYSSQETVSAASYSLKFLPDSLLERARKWVERPGGAFTAFASVGIREWTYPSDLAAKDPREASQRENIATSKLLEAVGFASPLVEIDELLLQEIHGSGASGLKYEFSEIPFSGSEPIVAGLQNYWAGSSTQTHNNDVVRGALNPVSDRTEIVIFSTFAAPLSIPVFKSLTDPIRNQWLAAKANGATDGFWKFRRARPLRQFVPIRPGAFQAFVTGWVLGRMTGHIQVLDNPYGAGLQRVEIYSETKSSWLSFPADPDLLGAQGLGVKAGTQSEDLSRGNIPPVLLENFGLALSKVAGMDLTPLDPYWAVVDLGLSLKWVGKQSGVSPLERLIRGSDQPHGKVTMYGAPGIPLRLEEPIEYLRGISEAASKLAQKAVNSPTELESLPRSFEIAPEVVIACEYLEKEFTYLTSAGADAGKIDDLDELEI